MSRPLEKCSASCCLLENVSLYSLGHGTLVCAHDTTILTNHEPSKLVGERIFHDLQVRIWTIIKENVYLKNIFRCTCIISTHSPKLVSIECHFSVHMNTANNGA